MVDHAGGEASHGRVLRRLAGTGLTAAQAGGMGGVSLGWRLHGQARVGLLWGEREREGKEEREPACLLMCACVCMR